MTSIQVLFFIEPYILSELREGNFKLITTTEVIEHTVDTADFIKRLAIRLATGGILLITAELYDANRYPDPSIWPYLAQDFGQHITFLSEGGLRALADKVGLHWWASLEFAGCRCIHLLSKTLPSQSTIQSLYRRHEEGETRILNDASI